MLHKVQSQYGYLAETHLDAVAQLMQVPAAKVAGVGVTDAATDVIEAFALRPTE